VLSFSFEYYWYSSFRNFSLLTATCKNSSSDRCFSAANLVCKDVDIFRKTVTSLKLILRQSLMFFLLNWLLCFGVSALILFILLLFRQYYFCSVGLVLCVFILFCVLLHCAGSIIGTCALKPPHQ